jgi:methylenetetrahydrofolate reductase (NADPH)
MKVIEKIKTSDHSLFSFELLPPLKGTHIDQLYKAIDPLIEFNPLMINVTYHQQEGVFRNLPNGLLERHVVRKRPGTVAISAAINYKYGITTVPHIICGGFSKEETEDALIDLHFLGIRNILALRGDAQKGERYFVPQQSGHAHASELVEQISNMNRGKYLDESLENASPTDFSVGVAGYPEKHFESPNMDSDLRHLKAKVDAGADYIITQMFFDNKKYFDFVKSCREAGIKVPILAGLKPIITRRDIEVLPQVFHIDIPEELVKEVGKCKTNSEAKEAGIEWTIRQSKELMQNGVPALHYYTIGISDNIQRIARAIF